MKKLITIVSLMLSLFACQTKESTEHIDNPDFEGMMEQLPETKTSLSGNTVIWETGDHVAIFEGAATPNEYAVSNVSSYGTTCSFTLQGSKNNGDVVLDKNIALYPYYRGALAEKVEYGYAISGVELPSEQEYSQDSFGKDCFPMVGMTKSVQDKRLNFKNVCGLLEINLAGTETIESIALTGNKNEKISGTAKINVSEAGIPSIERYENAGNTITLSMGTAGVQLKTPATTSFYFAVPPTEFTNGFKVTITEKNGTTHTINTDKHQSITRSCILSMPGTTVNGGEIQTETPEALKGWGVVGTFNNWGQNGEKDITMSYDGEWMIGKNIKLDSKAEIKFRRNQSWANNYGSQGNQEFEHKVDVIYENPSEGGPNIVIPDAGTYDFYLSGDFKRYKYTKSN